MKSAIFAYAMGLSIICVNITVTAGDFKYSLFQNRLIITRYTGRDKHVIVPETLDGYPVSMIGRNAFRNKAEMVSITLPETITGLGDRAFYGCAGLTEIILPDRIVFIGDQAFSGCTSLTDIHVDKNNREFTGINGVLFDKAATTLIQYPIGRQQETYSVPDGVIMIGNCAFRGASKLTTIEWPDSLAVIGDSAFRNVTSLTHIVLPEGVTFVRDSAFRGCTALTEITIPESVTGIGWAAFQGCTRLANVTIMNGVRNLGGSIFSECSSLKEIFIPGSVATIGDRAFDGCTSLTGIQVADDNIHYVSDDGVLIHKDSRTLLQHPLKRSGSYRVPDGIIHIADNAFQGCMGLTEVSLPGSVAVIGNSAFRDCENLIHVHWDNKHRIELENHDVHQGTDSMAVTTARDWQRIGDAAFRNCTKLKTITLPNRVKDIGATAFSGCNNLKEIHLGEHLTSLGEAVFRECSSLTNITLPASLTNLGRVAFSQCSALLEIDVADDNQTFTAVDGVVFDKQRRTLLRYPPGRKGHYTIPDGVETIGAAAFGNTRSLPAVTVPQSVRTIGGIAFVSCPGLKALYFKGDKPMIAPNAIRGNVTLYYRNGTNGWDVETSQLSLALWTAFPDPMDPGKQK